MVFLWSCFIVFISLVLVWHFLTRKYLNPYKLIMVFGKKGSGKTTLLTKLAFTHHQKGWKVYSTEPVPYAHMIEPEEIGYVHLDPHSVLLIDEVGMIYDNRNYKQFKPEVRDFFKLQRHYKVKVYMFSQTFDIDVKLRNLCDHMYLVTNVLRVFSWAKKIRRTTVLVASTGESESRIAENLEFEPFIFWPFGSRFLTYIPHWSKFFDSHFTRPLRVRDFEQIPGPERPQRLRVLKGGWGQSPQINPPQLPSEPPEEAS